MSQSFFKQDLSNVNFKTLVNNRRFLLLAVACGLASILVLSLGIIPQIQSIFQTRDDLSASQQRLERLQKKNSQLASLQAVEAYSSVDEVNQTIPSHKPLLELLSALNLVAGKTQVSIGNLSLSPGEIASASAEFLDQGKNDLGKKAEKGRVDSIYETMNVELSIAGFFSDVQEFLLEIERVAPMITITSLGLDIKSEDVIRPSDLVQADLVLQTYYFTQSIRASLDSPLPQIGNKETEIVAEIKDYLYPNLNQQTQIQGGGVEDLFGFGAEL